MFSRKFDTRFKVGGAVFGAVGLCATLIIMVGVRNDVLDVGYRPQQPVPFSHKLHAGELNISCQYCHAGVERSAFSPVPTTQTCMNCHTVVLPESPKLQLVRESFENGKPIVWERVHKVPDYVHFNHSRHIRAQMDCKSCHGPVEEMGVVSQFKPLTMAWCLDCHRNPADNIVGARPISGVFTGDIHDVANLMSGSGYMYQAIPARLGKAIPIVEPSYGATETEMPVHQVSGIPHPKVAGMGPEACSSCHY